MSGPHVDEVFVVQHTQVADYGFRRAGTIPAELGALAELNYLGLGSNQLTGESRPCF